MRLVETAGLYPNACLCGHGRGPFVDTMIDKPILGRVYLCAELCVTQAARLVGGADPEAKAHLDALLSDASERETELKAQLKEARKGLVSDMLDFLRQEDEVPA